MSDTKRLVFFNGALVIVIALTLLLCFKPKAAFATSLGESTVYYYGGGGESADGKVSFSRTYSGAVTLETEDAFQNGSKKLIAWYGTDGKFYKPGSTIARMGTVQLMAVWQSGNTVVYDANGGTAGENGANMHISTYLVSSADLCYYHSDNASKLFERTGYGFVGWSESPEGRNVSFAPPTVSEAQLPLALYAVWAKDGTYNKITYVSGGASDTQNVPMGEGAALPMPEHSNDSLKLQIVYDHYFAGWYTMPQGGDFVGHAGETFIPTGDVALYARWLPYPENEGGINVTGLEYKDSSLKITGFVEKDLLSDDDNACVMLALYNSDGKMICLEQSEQMTGKNCGFVLSANYTEKAARAILFCINTVSGEALTESVSLG